MSTTTIDDLDDVPGSTGATPRVSTMDELAALSVGELRRVYARAEPPESLDALAGAPAGRMLSVVGPLDRPGVRSGVARLAKARWFPWRGKTFRAFDAASGEGVNRVTLLGDKYRFGLSLGRSVLDDRPCVVLDYDRTGNPWAIRQIRDELREVSPGLFLGPALLTTGRRPRLVLFFGIDHT
jgi:hypothetical protein